MSKTLSPSLSYKVDNSPSLSRDFIKGRMPARSYAEAINYLKTSQDRPYTPTHTKNVWGYIEDEYTIIGESEYKTHPKATRVQKRDNGVAVKYHDTDVITYTELGLVLNTNGFRTNTTKARIEEALQALPKNDNSVRYISVANRKWSIGGKFFYDGIVVGWDGQIVDYDQTLADKALAEFNGKNAIVDRYHAAFKQSHSAGDYFDGAQCECHICYNSYLYTDHKLDRDHVVEHMQNNELIGAILVEALNIVAHSRADYDTLTGGYLRSLGNDDIFYRRMKRGLRQLVGLPK